MVLGGKGVVVGGVPRGPDTLQGMDQYSVSVSHRATDVSCGENETAEGIREISPMEKQGIACDSP